MSRRAFTALELLVVVLIIGVLIALLLPAVARSRAAAVDVECKSRLRQLAAAEFLYAHDNHDMLTPRLGDPAFLAPGRSNSTQWQLALGRYIPLPPVIPGASPPVLDPPGCFDTRWIINCPTEPPLSSWSYALNDYMGHLPSDYDHYVGPWGYRLSRTHGSSDMILLGDATYVMSRAGESSFGGDSMTPAGDPSPALDDPAFRHGPQHAGADGHPAGWANFAFADGHAEGLRYPEVAQIGRHWKWW